jgi:chemotaxis protein MotB
MKVLYPLLAILSVAFSGCVLASRTDLDAALARNRSLGEQNRAQLAEIENLNTHSRNMEDQLMLAEQRSSSLEEQLGLDKKRLANYQAEREKVHDHVQELVNARLPGNPEVNRRLAELSRRCPNLRFDPQTGVSKLDTDVLFDSGHAELKPGSVRVLDDLARVLQSPEAHDLKVLVVGHTDDKPIKRPGEQYASNFDLSTARAEAVANHLRRLGLDDQRLGVAGFASHQPVAPNVSRTDRQKNRRVEIFVMSPDAPLVGWTDSTPGLY